jgi:hypothetical protein
MQKTINKLGRLISTTDMKLARKLGEIVDVEAITRGHRVHFSRTECGTICFMLSGELYEVQNV